MIFCSKPHLWRDIISKQRPQMLKTRLSLSIMSKRICKFCCLIIQYVFVKSLQVGSERSKYDCKVDFSSLISNFYVDSELRCGVIKFSITRYFVTIWPEMLETWWKTWIHFLHQKMSLKEIIIKSLIMIYIFPVFFFSVSFVFLSFIEVFSKVLSFNGVIR